MPDEAKTMRIGTFARVGTAITWISGVGAGVSVGKDVGVVDGSGEGVGVPGTIASGLIAAAKEVGVLLITGVGIAVHALISNKQTMKEKTKSALFILALIWKSWAIPGNCPAFACLRLITCYFTGAVQPACQVPSIWTEIVLKVTRTVSGIVDS